MTEEELKKPNLDYLRKKSVSSILMACLAIGVLALATWAWFANNKKVDANDIAVKAESNNILVSYKIYSNTREEAVSRPIPTPTWSDREVLDDNNALSLYGFLKKPGDSVVIKVEVTNQNSTPVSLNEVGFLAPTASQEVANSKSALLGTQLYVAKVASESADTAETVSGKAGYSQLYDGAKELAEQSKINILDGPLTMSAGASASVYIRVVFNEANVPQNEYKSFGKAITGSDGNPTTDGYCARNIYVVCEPITVGETPTP